MSFRQSDPRARSSSPDRALAEASAACGWDPGVTRRCPRSAGSWDALTRGHL